VNVVSANKLAAVDYKRKVPDKGGADGRDLAQCMQMHAMLSRQKKASSKWRSSIHQNVARSR
jgi:hypothetical protein